MTVSKRMRFEILRRDSYTCRYCGHRAPEVELVVDHMTPIALGGTDESANLVTACVDCNTGKTSATVDDPLVAEIDARAQQLMRAMAVAAEMRRQSARALEAACQPVRERWLEFYYASDEEKPEGERRRFPLPDDWHVGVRHYLAAGLPIEDMVDLVEVAMRGNIETRTDDGRWRYYMGCCKRSLAELEKTARALVDAQDDATSPAHPSTATDLAAQEPTLEDLP